MIWKELGVSGGTALIVLLALYFVIKWAVRNGIREAYERISGERRGWSQTLWGAIASEETSSGPEAPPDQKEGPWC